MRSALLVSIAATLCLASPVSAQGLQLIDQANDVVFMGGGTPVPAGFADRLDLRGLHIAENPSEFIFVLNVTSAATHGFGGGPLDSGLINIDFKVGKQAYRIELNRPLAQDMDVLGALYKWDFGSERFLGAKNLNVLADEASNSLTVAVDRTLLVNENNVAATAGQTITGWSVHAIGHVPGIATTLIPETAEMTMLDSMPDQGVGPDYEVLGGARHSGNALLQSPAPLRASNGETGTLIFSVRAFNQGAQPDDYKLSVGNAPAGWHVALPSDDIVIQGHGMADVPVLVTLPFTHFHGTLQTFTLKMESATSLESKASIDLGVQYLAIPQPAGHHNTLFLHVDPAPQAVGIVNTFTAGTNAYLSMNTVEPTATSDTITAKPSGVAGNVTYSWFAYLEPSLQIGIDFHPGEGSLTIPIQSTHPISGMLSGRLVLLDPLGNESKSQQASRYPPYSGRHVTELGTLTSKHVSISRDAQTVDAIFRPSISEPIGFASGRSLVLELHFYDTSGAPGLEDVVTNGGFLILPLNEYSDPVTSFVALGGVHLETLSATKRIANPGARLLFEGRIHNTESQARALNITLQGTAKHWASFIGEPSHALAADATQTVRFSVTVPKDATSGTRGDVVLDVGQEGGRHTLELFSVVVDTSKAIPDDSATIDSLATHGKATPGTSVGLLACLTLLCAALVEASRKNKI